MRVKNVDPWKCFVSPACILAIVTLANAVPVQFPNPTQRLPPGAISTSSLRFPNEVDYPLTPSSMRNVLSTAQRTVSMQHLPHGTSNKLVFSTKQSDNQNSGAIPDVIKNYRPAHEAGRETSQIRIDSPASYRTTKVVIPREPVPSLRRPENQGKVSVPILSNLFTKIAKY